MARHVNNGRIGSSRKGGPAGRRLSGSAYDGSIHSLKGSRILGDVTSGGMGVSGGTGNFTTDQLPEVDVDIKNVYPANKYLPKNLVQQHALFRQIYRYDVVAGACIELYIHLPWSTFEVTGIEDRHIRQVYEDSYNNLQMDQKLPYISLDYLILGKACGNLNFNDTTGLWDSMIQHNPDYVEVIPNPIQGQSPILTLTPPRQMQQLARRLMTANYQYQFNDEENQKILQQLASQRRIPLAEGNSFYLPRKSSAYDYRGTSIYSRIMGLILIEGALMQANLLNAYRRAGPIRVITPKEEAYYDTEQLDSIALMFMEADEDPTGSTIVLRESVDINTLGSANSDQWRAFDDWDTIQSAKLTSMGFSESFLNGDQTHVTTDVQLSVFLERIKAHRDHITNELLIGKIAGELAEVHGFYKRSKANLKYRIRTDSGKGDLILPKIKFHKSLSPTGDREFIELMEQAEEKGLPISLRTMAAAYGVDFEDELAQMDQDVRDREEVHKYRSRFKTDEDDSMFASFGNIESRPEMSEFNGKLTPANFKLLGRSQVLNGLRYVNSDADLQDVLPKTEYVLMQLFFKAAGFPYRRLDEDDLSIIRTALTSRLGEDDMQLEEFLIKAMDGITEVQTESKPQEKVSESDIDDAVNQHLDEESEIIETTQDRKDEKDATLEVADVDVHRDTKQLEIDDSGVATNVIQRMEEDHASDHATDKVRTLRDGVSNSDLSSDDLSKLTISETPETQKELAVRLNRVLDTVTKDSFIDMPKVEKLANLKKLATMRDSLDTGSSFGTEADEAIDQRVELGDHNAEGK